MRLAGIERHLSWVGFFLRHADRSVGWRRLLWAYRQGHLPQRAALYGLPRPEQLAYLGDREWIRLLSRINGAYAILLHNKLVFHRLLAAHSEHLPELHGLLWRGRFLPEPGCAPGSLDRLLERVEASGGGTGLVVKPLEGAFGRGIQMLHPDATAARWTANGQHLTRGDLAARLLAAAHGEPLLVSEYVRPAAYARELYPHASNSVRVLTMRDAASGEVFVAAAVQRIGVAASRPVDNFSAGGLSAWVDVGTGELGAAQQKQGAGRPLTHAAHPETGARIGGLLIPRWPAIVERLLAMAEALPFVTYVGWDVLVTDDGFKVLEGNSNPDVDLIQVHRPLLEDTRIRRFYAAHGVRRRRQMPP